MEQSEISLLLLAAEDLLPSSEVLFEIAFYKGTEDPALPQASIVVFLYTHTQAFREEKSQLLKIEIQLQTTFKTRG